MAHLPSSVIFLIIWPIVHPALSFLVREGTWVFESLLDSPSFNKTWQLHGKKLTCTESLLMTLFALVIVPAVDTANAFTDRKCCPGNVFSVHSWLLEPFITSSLPPPWCRCLNRDACHEATVIPLREAPKQNQNHNSKNIYGQFMTNCQAKTTLTDSKSALEIIWCFYQFFPCPLLYGCFV